MTDPPQPQTDLNPVMSANIALAGCLLVLFSPLIVGLFYILSMGFARRTAPKAESIMLPDMVLSIECAANSKETRGAWPITYISVCPDLALIRGELKPRFSRQRAGDYRITIKSSSGQRATARCHPAYRNSCYFQVDLRPARLIGDHLIAVLDDEGRSLTGQPRQVKFQSSTSYSLAWWDGLMGI